MDQKIELRTNKKTLNDFGLEKIPDTEIIKMLKVEIGQLSSYIEELELENKKLKEGLRNSQKLLKEEKTKNKENTLYLREKEKVRKLKERVITLKDSISDLLTKLNSADRNRI